MAVVEPTCGWSFGIVEFHELPQCLDGIAYELRFFWSWLGWCLDWCLVEKVTEEMQWCCYEEIFG